MSIVVIQHVQEDVQIHVPDVVDYARWGVREHVKEAVQAHVRVDAIGVALELALELALGAVNIEMTVNLSFFIM